MRKTTVIVLAGIAAVAILAHRSPLSIGNAAAEQRAVISIDELHLLTDVKSLPVLEIENPL